MRRQGSPPTLPWGPSGPLYVCPPLGPILTHHMDRERMPFIIIFHSRPSLQPKEVYYCVPPLGLSDVQGAVFGPGVSKEEESALGLAEHCMRWVVCGHCRRISIGIHPFSEPVAMSCVGVFSAFPGIVDGAGHADTQALLHRHGRLHVQPVSRIISQGPCGERRISPAPGPRPPPCLPLTRPQQRQQQRQHV